MRKTFEVNASETLFGEMETLRIRRSAINCLFQFFVEFLRKPRGYGLIITKDFRHIVSDQRVENYSHAARSRWIDAQNSSELRARTFPESSCSRRRPAS